MYKRADFAYEAAADIYRYPTGEALPYRYVTEEDGLELRRYWTSECGTCLMRSRCSTGKEHRVTRWAHEHLVEAAQARLIGLTEPMTIRRGTGMDKAARRHWRSRLIARAADSDAHLAICPT